MALFTDTVTVYNKISDTEWKATVVKGVQWSEKQERQIVDGVISIARYVSVTFPKGTYEDIVLDSRNTEDCIIYGEVEDEVNGERGSRVSDLLEKYPKSGRIKSANDNSKRDFLGNIKVVVA